MSSGATAQDPAWKSREQSEEARYAHQKEQAQLEVIKCELEKKSSAKPSDQETHPLDKDFEGGFGGQENLEDRYATTSGEH